MTLNQNFIAFDACSISCGQVSMNRLLLAINMMDRPMIVKTGAISGAQSSHVKFRNDEYAEVAQESINRG